MPRFPSRWASPPGQKPLLAVRFVRLEVGQAQPLETGRPGGIRAKLGLEISRLEHFRPVLGRGARTKRAEIEIVGEAEAELAVLRPAHLRHLEAGLAEVELDLGARAKLRLG